MGTRQESLWPDPRRNQPCVLSGTFAAAAEPDPPAADLVAYVPAPDLDGALRPPCRAAGRRSWLPVPDPLISLVPIDGEFRATKRCRGSRPSCGRFPRNPFRMVQVGESRLCQGDERTSIP